jgi:hypothetical protein
LHRCELIIEVKKWRKRFIAFQAPARGLTGRFAGVTAQVTTSKSAGILHIESRISPTDFRFALGTLLESHAWLRNSIHQIEITH